MATVHIFVHGLGFTSCNNNMVLADICGAVSLDASSSAANGLAWF